MVIIIIGLMDERTDRQTDRQTDIYLKSTNYEAPGIILFGLLLLLLRLRYFPLDYLSHLLYMLFSASDSEPQNKRRMKPVTPKSRCLD
jgi:hypothetical protein